MTLRTVSSLRMAAVSATLLAQAAIEDAHGWIAADCRERGHVEEAGGRSRR